MKLSIQARGTDQITIGSRVVATMDGQAQSVLECLTPLSSFDICFSLALHGFGSCADFKCPHSFLELLRAPCSMLFVDHECDDSFELQK